jgi:hypothetical protein
LNAIFLKQSCRYQTNLSHPSPGVSICHCPLPCHPLLSNSFLDLVSGDLPDRSTFQIASLTMIRDLILPYLLHLTPCPCLPGIHSSSFSRSEPAASSSSRCVRRSIEGVLCPKHRECSVRAMKNVLFERCKGIVCPKYRDCSLGAISPN